ncbi:hypothetical protein EV144_10438 [Flavobacterium sp. 270]|uniref:hypothetical protein n=1 Tax=Flavobacterium sp. 270 TaxID=2512114 RepID=UPI001064C6D9|nr:hypothetical protein [Flavobacterium sp. 270]TDW47756.1 hypothetical protein EV144_10438 [Flavobacterium sp. 270]
MKKLIVILFAIFSYSCQSQKNNILNYECNVIKTQDLKEFDSLIKSIDTTKLFNNALKNFENTKDGVLFYKLTSGNKFGYFTIFTEEDSKIYCQNISKDLSKKVNVNDKDRQIIINGIELIKESSTFYYEQCNKDSTDFIYLLIIKREGKIISKYLSHNYSEYLDDNKNNDLKTIKSLLGVSYMYSYK